MQKMYFIITIDTEGDNQWKEESRRNIKTENAKYLARFQMICEEYGFKPTYLTTYEMAEDKFFMDFAKSCLERRTCEIGAHPHAWNNPPEYDLTGDDGRYAPYLMEYPEQIIYDKMNYLKRLLEDNFETEIVSHRAGRWGLNETYAKILHSLGFKVDCTVTPFVSWESHLGKPDGCGGSDFSSFPTTPYFPDLEDISKPGGSSLLELPMTVRKHYTGIFDQSHNLLLRKVMRNTLLLAFGPQVLWFRPNRYNKNWMLRLLKKIICEPCPYIMFMLHSSELMPGENPTFLTGRQINGLYGDINYIFKHIALNGIKGVTCSEYYDILTKGEGRLTAP